MCVSGLFKKHWLSYKWVSKWHYNYKGLLYNRLFVMIQPELFLLLTLLLGEVKANYRDFVLFALNYSIKALMKHRCGMKLYSYEVLQLICKKKSRSTVLHLTFNKFNYFLANILTNKLVWKKESLRYIKIGYWSYDTT